MTSEEREAFASLEQSMTEMLALFKCIARDRIKVTITKEVRDGKDGLRIDALIDGKVDEAAEGLIREMLVIAAPVAALLAANHPTADLPN